MSLRSVPLKRGKPTVGSLFSGIGGLDLGLERAGMSVLWQSEIDPYCCKVLAKHWPDVPNLGDVKEIDWSEVERPDVICGGYPCQPFSVAGLKLGDDDARHLWPFMSAAIRVLRPRYAILENVPGHLVLGFGAVLADVAESGYCVQWDCIPAGAVGAPHIRDRLFAICYRPAEVAGRPGGERRLLADTASNRQRPHSDVTQRPSQQDDRADIERSSVALAHTDSIGRDRRAGFFGPTGRAELADGREWDVEPDVGRVADGVPSRVDRLRGLGNAVVPQVAEFIGRQLMAAL